MLKRIYKGYDLEFYEKENIWVVVGGEEKHIYSNKSLKEVKKFIDKQIKVWKGAKELKARQMRRK